MNRCQSINAILEAIAALNKILDCDYGQTGLSPKAIQNVLEAEERLRQAHLAAVLDS